MKVFRNPEIYRGSIAFAVISALAVIFSFIWQTAYGIFTLFICIAFYIVFITVNIYRYNRISRLASEIDKVLHGSGDIFKSGCDEGELSLLENEINKMTTRLYEQKLMLVKEKARLADLIADISHQIRTPLTSINLTVSLLSVQDIDYGERMRLTGELYMLLARIDSLISSLLKISRLDADAVIMKSEEAELSELVERAVSPLTVMAELRGVEIKKSAEGRFTGDIQWMSEAVGNIVKNCMEHTREGGYVNITATETALYSEITITDNGSGIDNDDIPHIFDRFYKGKNSGANNIGIGLALSRMIIIKQGGTVKAENNRDKGAKFTIKLYKNII